MRHHLCQRIFVKQKFQQAIQRFQRCQLQQESFIQETIHLRTRLVFILLFGVYCVYVFLYFFLTLAEYPQSVIVKLENSYKCQSVIFFAFGTWWSVWWPWLETVWGWIYEIQLALSFIDMREQLFLCYLSHFSSMLNIFYVCKCETSYQYPVNTLMQYVLCYYSSYQIDPIPTLY